MATQRTKIEAIVWTCTPIKDLTPVSLNLMGVNIALPPTVPHNQYVKQSVAQLALALAPLISIMKLAGMISAIIDMLKSVITLNPPKMIEAFKKIIEIISDITGMIPATAIPKFIFDLLRLYVQLLDVLIEEVGAIVTYEDALNHAANPYNSAQILCALTNVATMKSQMLSEVQQFLLILEPINVLLGLIGMDEISVDSGGTFDGLLAMLRVLRNTISAIVGSA